MTIKSIAGSEQDFMKVNHLLLKGTEKEIGKSLAEYAFSNLPTLTPLESTPEEYQAQKGYLQRNYSQLYERSLGVSEVYKAKGLSENTIDSALWYCFGGSACTSVFYPGSTTSHGHSYLSRNYDFTTGTITGERPVGKGLSATSRPHVIEMYPDDGYSSLSLCSYELLGGTIDGINSEGLTVCVHGADEHYYNHPMEPSGQPGVGLHELQVARMLLDSCANCDEAREKLLSHRQYYMVSCLQYLIADARGNSFIWQPSFTLNRHHILPGTGNPQILTNCLMSNYQSSTDFPMEEDENRFWMYSRYTRMEEMINEKSGEYDERFITQSSRRLFFDHLDRSDLPQRTLWHSLYNLDERSLKVDFYLGERESAEGEIKRSGYREFRLKN